MQRSDLEQWFAHHSQTFGANPGELLDRCESGVRDQAHREAWVHARDIAEESLHRFDRIFGLPASDTFVTREVCHEIARELRNHEPHAEEPDETEWVGRNVIDALDPEAQRMLHEWLSELAEKEEHEAWREIVYFTDHLARTLIRKAHMDNKIDWDFDHTYPQVASRVTRMIIGEYESKASAELDASGLRIVPTAH